MSKVANVSPVYELARKAFSRGKTKSARVFCIAFIVGYLGLWLIDGVIGTTIRLVSGYATWAVPLMLAISLTLFGSLVQLYELIGEAYGEVPDEAVNPSDVRKLLSSVEAVTIEVIGNALVSIGAVGLYYLIDGLRAIPADAVPYPNVLMILRPHWIALSLLLGLGSVIVALMFNQFSGIPDLIKIYRYLTVGRMLPPDEDLES